MDTPLSKKVAELLDGYPYIKSGLKDDIVNFSALARKISPELEKHLGKKVNLDSVMVAIKRYADRGQIHTTTGGLSEYLGKLSITMQDNVSFAVIENDSENTTVVHNTLRDSKWGSTELRFLLETPSTKTIIMRRNRLEYLLNQIPDRDKVKAMEDNFSIITLRLPMEAFKNADLISEFSSELSKAGITYMAIAAPQEIHYVVKEPTAQRAYAALKNFAGAALNGKGEEQNGKSPSRAMVSGIRSA